MEDKISEMKAPFIEVLHGVVNELKKYSVEEQKYIINVISGVNDKIKSKEEVKPEPRKITLIITIDGIYGQCKFKHHTSLPNNNWDTVNMLTKPTRGSSVEFDQKYHYSYETRYDDSDEVVTGFQKEWVKGLPTWASEDEYYKMCTVQQSKIQTNAMIEANIRISGYSGNIH
jgi:hypothetical protein